MKQYICFDDWEQPDPDTFACPSGCSEKHWLFNPYTSQIGLFKYPKLDQNGNVNTYEHISEDLASNLAKLLDIPCCKTDIGYYHQRVGSMSYLVNDPNKEVLVEGVNCITYSYPNYDPNLLIDRDSKSIYSLQMIYNSLKKFGLWVDFLKIPLFDFFIGNSDRHQSNWAIIINIKDIQAQLSPLYDNGSSLCAFIKDEEIDCIFKDKNRLNSILNTKSRSRIGIENNKKPTHKSVVEYLANNYKKQTQMYVGKYAILTDDVIEKVLSEYDKIIPYKRKCLLKYFLTEKRNQLLETYKL